MAIELTTAFTCGLAARNIMSSKTDTLTRQGQCCAPSLHDGPASTIAILSRHLEISGSGFRPLIQAPGCGASILPITFDPIVVSAEHLAVLGRTPATLAPCGNMVRLHFGELPYLALIGIRAYCAERTI